jgi:hypothetical protein
VDELDVRSKEMKTTLTIVALLIGSPLCQASDRAREDQFLALLHKLQYVETAEDVAKIIPNCPKPVADAGEDNTEIKIKTKLFGFDATGEFNFHKGVLVSHGFEVRTPDYKSAHDVFLEGASILNSQVHGLRLTAALPFGIDGKDGSDGPKDEMNIYLDGIQGSASFQLRLDMRQNSIVVGWGAQKVSPSEKPQIEQAVPSDGNKPSSHFSPAGPTAPADAH